VSLSLSSSIVFESDAGVDQRVSLPCSNFVIPALNANPSSPSSSDVSKRLCHRSAPSRAASTQNTSNNCFPTEVMMFQSIKRFESLPAIIKDLLLGFVIATGEIWKYFFDSSQLESLFLREEASKISTIVFPPFQLQWAYRAHLAIDVKSDRPAALALIPKGST